MLAVDASRFGAIGAFLRPSPVGAWFDELDSSSESDELSTVVDVLRLMDGNIFRNWISLRVAALVLIPIRVRLPIFDQEINQE